LRSDIHNAQFYGVIAVLVVMLALGIGCLPSASGQGGQGPVISSLVAEHPSIYPVSYTNITCTASDPNGGELRYKWSSTGGTLIGEGATVRWDAPSSYGDYHIMVVVQDSAGRSTEGTVTVTVVLKPESACCGRAR
jgi:F0F1-type ATP synthase membrane subunit c/vacuolar-type H+-ATPase subunit K